MNALTRVQRLLERARSGDMPTPHELSEVARQAREEAPLLEDEEGAALSRDFNALLQLAEEEQDQRRAEMNQVSSGRKALAGYGSLRSQSRSQRLHKRA